MTRESHDNLDEIPDLSEFISKGTLTVQDVEIPNPNNPAKNLAAILYTGIV